MTDENGQVNRRSAPSPPETSGIRSGATRRPAALRLEPFGPWKERRRRLSYLVARYLLRRPYLVAHAADPGLRLRFRTPDAVGRRIYQTGVYEPAVTHFLARDLELDARDVVVDVGANIGWHALVLDCVAPEGVRLFAFEPDPLNFDLLAENLERNGAARVVPVRKALTDREGTRRLHLYPDKNRGRHSLSPFEGSDDSVEVSATTLDRFWERHDLGDRRLGLLKIDVEGHEYHVLQGARRRLQRCAAVVLEHAPSLMKRAGVDPRSLVDFLLAHRFRPHRLEEGGPRPVEPAALLDVEGPVDLLWRREQEGRS